MRSYGFKFQWADGYDAARRILVEEGQADVQVVPGMTVPTDLSAQIAVRTREAIQSVEAEYPDATAIRYLGTRDGRSLYEVRFSRLGENRLTVRYGNGRHVYLEFFCTEPLETLIRKRAAFIAHCQHRDPVKWYNGLISEWNNETGVLLGPDNYDQIGGWRIYEVSCDDPGLSKPAFLAAKNAEYPTADEISALDYYLQHFVWGGLQRTTEETYPFGIYGIPDWKTNRESRDPGRNGQLHLWRIYDYPHVIAIYFNMYRTARSYPHIRMALPAAEYLRRAYGTAMAMFTVPMEIEKWSAYETGLYNELVIADLIEELKGNGMIAESERLREHWERKVRHFVNSQPDLFGSEYPFDSTGFEATQALARYAVEHADRPGQNGCGVSPENARRFMDTQIAANVFCRGWLEPAYYLLGSDYRATGGDAYTLSYMSQMGGWAVLDYGLYFASDPSGYLRLGYASYLSSWALMNSGTAESNYGYWFPGKQHDGAAGGGFEPAPYGRTWLEQPHHRGSWYYSCEIDLGFCGALRMAATILADDPIFGRFCFGGDWSRTGEEIRVVPKDGLRRRFSAMLGSGSLHLTLEADRFRTSEPIAFREDLTELRFTLESDNPGPHEGRLRISGLPEGKYSLDNGTEAAIEFDRRANQPETILRFPVGSGGGGKSFVIRRVASHSIRNS